MPSVNYLMSGAAHIPYLLVSLRSLRRHWDGKVNVHCWPESHQIVDTIARAAPELHVVVNAREREHAHSRAAVRSNSQFYSKIRLMMSEEVGDGPNVYLDADTLVAGSLQPLLSMAASKGFAATQFNDWVTSGRMIRKRLNDLKQSGHHEVNSLVDHVVSKSYPSVNGGVFACMPGSLILPQWYSFCMLSGIKQHFIADERVLHLFNAPQFSNQFTIVRGGSFNCSPKHQPAALDSDLVRLWHGHGDSFVRPNKSRAAVGLWWPEWQACLEKNIGGCREWWPTCGNKYLKQLMEEQL